MDEQGVAVGWRFRNQCRAHGSACPRFVVDDDLRIEQRPEFFCNRARNHIGTAARGEGHDKGDSFALWPLTLRNSRKRKRYAGCRCPLERLATRKQNRIIFQSDVSQISANGW